MKKTFIAVILIATFASVSLAAEPVNGPADKEQLKAVEPLLLTAETPEPVGVCVDVAPSDEFVAPIGGANTDGCINCNLHACPEGCRGAVPPCMVIDTGAPCCTQGTFLLVCEAPKTVHQNECACHNVGCSDTIFGVHCL